MKIIITESQYKFLKKNILIEAEDDELTYVTKKKHRLYAKTELNVKNPFDWQDVPDGTKFKYNPSENEMGAWNQKFIFFCDSSYFYNLNKRTAYYGDDVLAPALKKFCKNKKDEITKKNLEKSKLTSDSISTYSKVQDIGCINKVKGPYQNAITWWKNKLNEPSFYEKLKRINKYTDAQTKEWIKKYKDYLYNNIKGPFCPKEDSDIFKKHFSPGYVEVIYDKNGKKTETQYPKGDLVNAGAFSTHTNEGNLIVVNSFNIGNDSKGIEAIFVHEFQHALYDLKPMTPHENWKKVFPYKVWEDNPNDNTNSSISNKESSTISKYGLKKDYIDWWKKELEKQTNEKTTSMDVGYVCRETELASRLVRIKNLLNYSTSQKITVNDFKKFIEYKESPYRNGDSYYIVLCWINNGMEDIETFLDNLDKYVVAKVEPNKDDLDMGGDYT